MSFVTSTVRQAIRVGLGGAWIDPVAVASVEKIVSARRKLPDGEFMTKLRSLSAVTLAGLLVAIESMVAIEDDTQHYAALMELAGLIKGLGE